MGINNKRGYRNKKINKISGDIMDDRKVLAVSKAILEYLKEIENENSILNGNLLLDEEKEFVKKNMNAFIIGLIADQSVKVEIAWSLPYKLYKRLNTFDFKEIVQKYTIEEIEEIIKTKPALHRYPSRMALYIYCAMNDIIKKYNSDANNIWLNRKADEIVRLLEEFKGISHKKASLGTMLLIRDLGINICDKQNVDIAYDVHIRRTFLRIGLAQNDIQDEILESARKIYPEYPGKLTTAFWTIGRDYCRPTDPVCLICPLSQLCEKNFEKTKNIKS